MGVDRVIDEQVAELDDLVGHLVEALLFRLVVELRSKPERHRPHETFSHCFGTSVR